MIRYRKGDMLMEAKVGSILAHACNCRGIWGAGIAAQFAEAFPASHEFYQQDCAEKGDLLLGTCQFYMENGDIVVPLFTSKGLGIDRDSDEEILAATELALRQLIKDVGTKVPINMPKINSGLFGVPWEKTEAILEKLEGNFVVWYLEE